MILVSRRRYNYKESRREGEKKRGIVSWLHDYMAKNIAIGG